MAVWLGGGEEGGAEEGSGDDGGGVAALEVVVVVSLGESSGGVGCAFEWGCLGCDSEE